jgi:hypothetical protein
MLNFFNSLLKEAGTKAKELRELLPYMKLDGLFSLDRTFMNIGLRHFLNLSKNGKEDYKWEDMLNKNGWEEVFSFGAQYHQNNVPDSRVVLGQGDDYNVVFNRLNAKFTNIDGREAVFKYASKKRGSLITTYPDKGTYNYYPGGNNFIKIGAESLPGGQHKVYDITPYDELGFESTMKWNVYKGLFTPNSEYWEYDGNKNGRL